MSLSTLVRIMKIEINNIHECKLKSDVPAKQELTHESYTYLQNHIACLVSTIFMLAQFILCFLQVLYPIINHRFNIKYYFCFINYKMVVVKYTQVAQEQQYSNDFITKTT